jgi:hypothetical protein
MKIDISFWQRFFSSALTCCDAQSFKVLLKEKHTTREVFCGLRLDIASRTILQRHGISNKTRAEPTSKLLPIVYLVRHGETAWTLSGQHTDIAVIVGVIIYG